MIKKLNENQKIGIVVFLTNATKNGWAYNNVNKISEFLDKNIPLMDIILKANKNIKLTLVNENNKVFFKSTDGSNQLADIYADKANTALEYNLDNFA